MRNKQVTTNPLLLILLGGALVWLMFFFEEISQEEVREENIAYQKTVAACAYLKTGMTVEEVEEVFRKHSPEAKIERHGNYSLVYEGEYSLDMDLMISLYFLYINQDEITREDYTWEELARVTKLKAEKNLRLKEVIIRFRF